MSARGPVTVTILGRLDRDRRPMTVTDSTGARWRAIRPTAAARSTPMLAAVARFPPVLHALQARRRGPVLPVRHDRGESHGSAVMPLSGAAWLDRDPSGPAGCSARRCVLPLHAQGEKVLPRPPKGQAE